MSYDNYIDSKVEYIGIIPESWEIIKNKHIFNKTKIIVGSNWDKYNVLSLTKKGVIIKDIEKNEGKMPSDFSIYQIVNPGNLLMCLFDIDVTPRCVGYIENKGIVSAAYTELSATDNIYMKYYYWWYLMLDIDKQLLHLSKNLRNSLSTEDFMALQIVKPPLEEQKQIANYLDKKTSKIDTTIAKNKELINLLEEKRTALINQVVTKGLNPEVPMKDSGIEWIGEIPEHWEIKSLKNVVNIIMGQSPDSNDINDEKKGFLFMQGNAEFTNLYPKPSEYCTAPKKISREGDILMSVRAPVGELNISDKRYGIGRGLCSIKAIKVESRFLWYYLIKSKGDFNYYSNGSTFDAITISNLSSFPIIIPPLHEQNQITSYLDKETSIIDKIIDKIKENINLLEEYKTSLIHHVVTGKIDVRGEEI